MYPEWVKAQRLSIAFMIVAMFWLHYALFNAWTYAGTSGWAFRIWEQGLIIQNIAAALVIYSIVADGHILARLFAALYLVAMVFTSLEVLACSTFIDPGSDEDLADGIWGITKDKFACGRMFGWATPYAQPVAMAIVGIWISLAWWRAEGAAVVKAWLRARGWQ